MKNLFKKLLKINYTFKIPNKKKVLVYDNNSVTILSKFFSENYNILNKFDGRTLLKRKN